MKYSVFFLLLLLLSGCITESIVPAANTIEGNWKWVESIGGIAGMRITADENNAMSVRFEKNGKYTLTKKETVLIQTTYEVKKGSSILASDLIPLIYYDGNDLMPQSFTVVNDTLFLADEIYDGYSHTYVRIK